eukprot:Partr_v1_DN24163_c0_g1_i1_m70984
MQFVIILLSFACLLITSVLTSTLTLDERKRIFDNMSLATKATISESNDATPSFEAVQSLICIHPSPGVILARYLLKETLGNGNFGQVIKVKDTCDNSEWALKSFTSGRGAHKSGSFEYESQIMNILGGQDSLISFKRALPLSKQAVMPLMLGTLTDQIMAVDKMNLENLKEITKQVVDGVFAAHTLNIVINDLKEENVLVEKVSPPKIRLSDFGLAYDTEKKENQWINGSPAYMPWEKKKGIVAGSRKSDDIWAIGAMVKFMIFGRAEYNRMLWRVILWYFSAVPPATSGLMMDILDLFSAGFGEVPQKVENMLRDDLAKSGMPAASISSIFKTMTSIPKFTAHFPEIYKRDPHLVSFLQRCLQNDDKKRATIEELKFHPFISS